MYLVAMMAGNKKTKCGMESEQNKGDVPRTGPDITGSSPSLAWKTTTAQE